MPVKISNFARPVQNRKYAGSTTPKYAAKERFRRLEARATHALVRAVLPGLGRLLLDAPCDISVL
jgi:hypothetical protein